MTESKLSSTLSDMMYDVEGEMSTYLGSEANGHRRCENNGRYPTRQIPREE